MITVLFPNPHFDDAFRRLAEPRWEKTALWEDLRRSTIRTRPPATLHASCSCLNAVITIHSTGNSAITRKGASPA